MDTKTIGLIALALGGGYFFLNANRQQTLYNTPYGQLPASQLPQYGYVNINGLWYPQNVVNDAGQTLGFTGTVQQGTNQWITLVNYLLNTGLNLYTTISSELCNDQKKTDLKNQIFAKYQSTVSIDYDPNFPYTQAQLDTYNCSQLNKILSTGSL